MAEHATLEEVAGILWNSDTREVFGANLGKAIPLVAQVLKLLRGYGDVDLATALFPLLEQADPRAYDLTPAGMVRTGADLLRWLSAIVVRRAAPLDPPIHASLAEALGLDADHADLLRRMLVLAADHSFEPGTRAVRAVASTGVTPWRAVLTGLSVTTGRQSRSRHYGEVARFLQAIIASDRPTKVVVRWLRDGEALPGSSSTAYTGSDPRAWSLLDACSRIYADDAEFQRLSEALGTARDLVGFQPSFPLANMFARHKLGLSQSDAPFIIGRSCGWIAHAIEQYQLGELRWGEASYNGRLPGP